MRRFILYRIEDESGVSGTGDVAEGVQFQDCKCALSWLTTNKSVAIYDDIETIDAIHGHNGKTLVRWIDE